jgi:hypothetical protein
LRVAPVKMTVMELVPIKENLEENEQFIANPDCKEILQMTLDYYKRIGFTPPWICYFAEENGVLVGSAGIKGKPQNGKIEIAYGTFDRFQHQGIGARICEALVLRGISPPIFRNRSFDNCDGKNSSCRRFFTTHSAKE